jgi:hypothetical protein
VPRSDVQWHYTPTLTFELVDMETRQRVFLAAVKKNGGCPDKFFDDVAMTLAKIWNSPQGNEAMTTP